jgi:hypothetical protein
MCAEKIVLDVTTSIHKHITMLKQSFPTRAFISVGNYSFKIFEKTPLLERSDGLLAFFVQKTKEVDVTRAKQNDKDALNIISLDEKAPTHYWFDVQHFLAENDAIVEKLKKKPIDKVEGAIIVASIGEGLGSALLTDLTERFIEANVNSVALAVMPSQLQPPDVHFNALWSIATCASKGLTQILIDRDALEGYVGVDREGAVLKGSRVLAYITEIMLSKDLFVQEFTELSKSYNLKMFTILAATGSSLRVYGSIKNILDAAFLRQLANFDLTEASTLYVLIRMPLQLKEKLTPTQIELAIDEWFSKKSDLKAVHISDPIYVDDGTDRLDIIMFVGGFDFAEKFASTNRKVKDIRAYAAKGGYIKEKEWQDLMKSLVGEPTNALP